MEVYFPTLCPLVVLIFQKHTTVNKTSAHLSFLTDLTLIINTDFVFNSTKTTGHTLSAYVLNHIKAFPHFLTYYIQEATEENKKINSLQVTSYSLGHLVSLLRPTSDLGGLHLLIFLGRLVVSVLWSQLPGAFMSSLAVVRTDFLHDFLQVGLSQTEDRFKFRLWSTTDSYLLCSNVKVTLKCNIDATLYLYPLHLLNSFSYISDEYLP